MKGKSIVANQFWFGRNHVLCSGSAMHCTVSDIQGERLHSRKRFSTLLGRY